MSRGNPTVQFGHFDQLQTSVRSRHSIDLSVREVGSASIARANSHKECPRDRRNSPNATKNSFLISPIDPGDIKLRLSNSTRGSMTSMALTPDFNSFSDAMFNTCSRPDSGSSAGSGRTTPNLHGNAPSRCSSTIPNSQSLFINPSHTSPNPSVVITGVHRVPSLPNLRKIPDSYKETVTEIMDGIFVSGIDAAYNQNLLCKLDIEHIIDVSGVVVSNIPRSKRSDVPCLCARTTAHHRTRMTIDMKEDSESHSFNESFKEINHFIDQTRQKARNILIHSYHGKNRCGVLAVQYMMWQNRAPFVEALKEVTGANSKIDISSNFYIPLNDWETYLKKMQRL